MFFYKKNSFVFYIVVELKNNVYLLVFVKRYFDNERTIYFTFFDDFSSDNCSKK